ncbi:MAG TPA: endonuclease domain-containing protein [Allosphingosinicella sp.]
MKKKEAPPPPFGRSPSPGNPGEDKCRRPTQSSPAFAGEGDHAKHGGGASSETRRPESPTARARRLRRNLSPAEAILWNHLRTRPAGFKFRCQHKAPPYTLDFYCHEAALCIEVDGDAHDMGNNPESDARRDAELATRGILSLRFLAADVFHHLDAVAAHIDSICLTRAPRRSPL